MLLTPRAGPLFPPRGAKIAPALAESSHLGKPVRRIVLRGAKLTWSKKEACEAVYLGPMAQVVDEYGNVLRRGERVRLNVHDCHVLRRSIVAGQFQFF